MRVNYEKTWYCARCQEKRPIGMVICCECGKHVRTKQMNRTQRLKTVARY